MKLYEALDILDEEGLILERKAYSEMSPEEKRAYLDARNARRRKRNANRKADEENPSEEASSEESKHWWKYTFRNDKCIFKCSHKKIVIKRKLDSGWKTYVLKRSNLSSALYEALNIRLYGYNRSRLQERLGIATRIVTYGFNKYVEYNPTFTQNRENVLHLTECLDHILEVSPEYGEASEKGCLAMVKKYLNDGVKRNDYGNIYVQDVSLSGRKLNISFYFSKKAYGDSYSEDNYGTWKFDCLSDAGGYHSADYPENAWWEAKMNRDFPSSTAQKVLFYHDGGEQAATANYFAFIADELCVTEHIDAD